VTVRLADLMMLAMQQAIADRLEQEDDAGGSELFFKVLRANEQPWSLMVDTDDDGILLVSYVTSTGDEVFSLPMRELLERPVRKPEAIEAAEIHEPA
jgi:hypothetical protein